MKRLFLICLFIISALPAEEIVISSTHLTIPSPEGYGTLTADMLPYADILKKFIPPANEQFAVFLPVADVAIAARGDVPKPKRWLYVQTTKSLIQPFTTTADFNMMKQAIKTQNEEILKKAKKEMPAIFDQASKEISDDFLVNLKVSVNQMIPIPAHEETARSLSYSMLLSYDIKNEDGIPSVYEAAVTMTLVHLSGKVLFLYASCDKKDLSWSRAESQQWAAKTIAANPSLGDVAAREARISSRSGFNWGTLISKMITGAAIGGVIGLLGVVFYAVRKKKVS